MDRTESMQELQSTVLKPFVTPKLVAQGTLVGETGFDFLTCYDSAGNVQFVDADSCESAGLFDSPPSP